MVLIETMSCVMIIIIIYILKKENIPHHLYLNVKLYWMDGNRTLKGIRLMKTRLRKTQTKTNYGSFAEVFVFNSGCRREIWRIPTLDTSSWWLRTPRLSFSPLRVEISWERCGLSDQKEAHNNGNTFQLMLSVTRASSSLYSGIIFLYSPN